MLTAETSTPRAIPFFVAAQVAHHPRRCHILVKSGKLTVLALAASR
jgi:hypothetical protein